MGNGCYRCLSLYHFPFKSTKEEEGSLKIRDFIKSLRRCSVCHKFSCKNWCPVHQQFHSVFGCISELSLKISKMLIDSP